MMQRIIATLLSLAVLLERSCYAPQPVRWFLVKLLLPVEPMVRWFVLRTAWEAGAIMLFLPDPVDPDADCLKKAYQLAECFRAFAKALQDLPKQLYERWRACEALEQALRRRARQVSSLATPLGALAPEARPALNDTS